MLHNAQLLRPARPERLHSGRLGIRYYAISVNSDDYDRISKGPCPSCGSRPHLGDDDYEGERETLDLDKSWGYFQSLFASGAPRPAAALVAGNVTNTPRGWISYQGAISPQDVAAIATDLAAITTEELRHHFLVRGLWGSGPDDRAQQDFEYVAHYLEHARSFTAEVAQAERGIVYYIG